MIGCCVFSQQTKIQIVNADQSFANQERHPGALVLNGNVRVMHKGAIMTCKKALLFQKENRLHAYGDVVINQADTLSQKSEHLQYDGNSLMAISWGDVFVRDKQMTLKTDTLRFDRGNQKLFYNCGAVIHNRDNVLTSKKGVYFARDKKFSAAKNVKIVNPKQTLTTENLDFYTTTGIAHLIGTSKIVTKESVLYTDKGRYDTRKGQGYLLKKSKIYHQHRVITGDSLYYDQIKDFASGTGKLVVNDTLNKLIVKGGYGEVYRKKDSVFVTKKPLAISLIEKDSLFIHGDYLKITGPHLKRKLQVYNHVKFYKSDLQGKCDSIVSFQDKGLTTLFKKPVIWSGNHQITGDTIHLLRNINTNQMDSLKVRRNAFVIQKDTLGIGYNQIQGRLMFGKFVNNEINELLTEGDGAVLDYIRDEDDLLTAIMNMESSNILFNFENQKIKTIKFLQQPDGKTYPPDQFPKELEYLKGFLWRETERPTKIEDIYIHD